MGRNVALRNVAVCAFVLGVASACEKSRGENGPDWTPLQAIKRCENAVARAQQSPPMLAKSREVQSACSALIRVPSCRSVAQRRFEVRSAVGIREVVDACSSAYCAKLEDPGSLQACNTKKPPGGDEWRKAWVELSQAMLEHDFDAKLLPRAARARLALANYQLSVPLPVAKAEPSEVVVRLEGDGSISVKRGNAELGRVESRDRLGALLPKDKFGGHSAAIEASPGADYEDVIATVDVLRTLGYENVSFQRQK